MCVCVCVGGWMSACVCVCTSQGVASLVGQVLGSLHHSLLAAVGVEVPLNTRVTTVLG